jgi:pimeloyl-ACP methyl ester carboxylesterase
VSLEEATIEKEVGTYTSFDGAPIYYESRGTGEPMVFVYGIACLMNHWHHQVSYFSKNYQAITYDLRGHHKSNPITNRAHLTVDAMAKDLLGLIEHLKVSNVHMFGHSFGVPIILEAFRQNPDAIKSMTFINGFAKNPIKGMYGLEVVEPFFYYVKAEFEKNPDLWNNLWKLAVYNPVAMRLAALGGGFNLRLTSFKDIEVYARGVAQMDLNIFLPLFEALMHFNGDEILSTINKPTLVISGENDRVTPKSFQRDFHEKIPGSEYICVPYGSHCTQLDFPDYVNLKIKEFLARIK